MSNCARIKCEISHKLLIFRKFHFNTCLCRIMRRIILYNKNYTILFKNVDNLHITLKN